MDDLISWKAVIEENVDKVRVSSAEIVVHGTKENPYYEIEYFDLSNNEIHIGFSSDKLDVVFGYLEKYFDIVNEENKSDQVQDYHSDDLISRKALLGTERLLMTDIVHNNPTAKYILEQVLYDIEHTDTAFDKEKVIEELKEMAAHSASCKNQCEFGSTEYFDYMGAEAAYKTTIEIVKKGGIE